MARPRILKIIRRRERLVEEVPAEFVKFLERAQNALYREIYDYLVGLDTENGRIRDIPANKQMAGSLRDQIRTWLRRHGYYAEVTRFGKRYDDLIKAGRDYYRALDLPGSFTDRDLESLSQLRKANLRFLRDNDQRVINVTWDTVTSSIYSNTRFQDLADRLKNLHTDRLLPDGRPLRGLLKRYGATHAFDAFAIFDRRIQNIKSAELGLEHFLYSGGLLKDSRAFCKDRVGRTFTRKEIDAWEQLQWRGKNTGRSVWDALGGHNCIHILSPVTADFEL